MPRDARLATRSRPHTLEWLDLKAAFFTHKQMKAQAQNILKNAVHTRYMPLGNLTKITDEERSKLAAWILSGARIDNERSPK